MVVYRSDSTLSLVSLDLNAVAKGRGAARGEKNDLGSLNRSVILLLARLRGVPVPAFVLGAA